MRIRTEESDEHEWKKPETRCEYDYETPCPERYFQRFSGDFPQTFGRQVVGAVRVNKDIRLGVVVVIVLDVRGVYGAEREESGHVVVIRRSRRGHPEWL